MGNCQIKSEQSGFKEQWHLCYIHFRMAYKFNLLRYAIPENQ